MMILRIILLFVCYVGLLSQSISNNHTLSFIMPCYNCEKTLARSLDSIYQQNLTIPFEVICTDDGSTDGTLFILRDYAQRYSNFYVYTHDYNIGGGAASNTCISHSSGDLIFRLDADNVLVPNSIGPLINLLDEKGSDAASFEESRFFTGDLVFQGSWMNTWYDDHICDLHHCLKGIGGDPSCSGNYLFTRKSYNRAGGYYEEHGSDTFCFAFKQYATGTRIAILPGTFYWHFYNPEGYWARGEKNKSNLLMNHKVFMDYQEVFSEESQKIIREYDGHEKNIMDLRWKIQLAHPLVLRHLFMGWRLEEDKKYTEAYNEFKKALKAGCVSKKIRNKVRYLKILSKLERTLSE